MSETPKPRILAVDDSRVMRRAMSKVLGSEYDVVEAEHGEDAWTHLLNDPTIQVVFTDLSMPYLDGFGLLERMRESDDPHLQALPVIIITGKDDDEETKQAALDKGASDFITKPFDSVQLRARAKAHVRFEQTTRKLSETSDRLEKQAAVDELTGLGGRRYFCKAAEEQLAYARRHGTPFILLRMDLDDFNRLFINLGKEQAEAILRQTGKTLQGLVRKEDMVARVGLAKFAMLFRDADMNDATDTARRILEGIQAMAFHINGHELHVTASIGLLEPAIDGDQTIEELIGETEIYLNKAVEAGGNQVAVKSLRKYPVEKTLSVPAAMRLLEYGHTDAILPHMQSLVSQLLPLLDFLARNLEGPAAENLATIRDRLGEGG
ncbi:MAG TPA: diguanylate cyclase [Gammaproteobacteria bacterium]|nr:diguanylate cyclase [Gammaproteobacteria bacterium]